VTKTLREDCVCAVLADATATSWPLIAKVIESSD
jgi:hypothetical protein